MFRFLGIVITVGALSTAGLVYFNVIDLSGNVSASVAPATKAQLQKAADDLRTQAAERIRPSK